MLRYQAPCKPEHIASLPEKCRAVVRYRPESFGYLAAFPNGKVGMYLPSAESVLSAGGSYEDCIPHLLTHLDVSPRFHFSAPLMAWLEITRRCNLRCPHCFVEGGVARGNEMDTVRILRLLDEWAEMGVFALVITGGEPSLHPDFLEIVRKAYDLGFVIGIASNGMPLTSNVLSRIPQDDVLISISLDGIHGQGAPTGETDFEAATRKIRAIRDAGFSTSIMTTTTRENVGDLQQIIEFARDNDVSLRSVPFMPMGRGRLHRELQNDVADVELAARFWLAEELWEREKDQTLGLCCGKVFNFLITMVYATRRCMSGRGLCYVDSAGEMYPCSNCSGGKILSGGSLQLSDFRELWTSETWGIRNITWDNFADTCRGCPISDDRFFCSGRCPGSSFSMNGTLYGCGVSEFQQHSIQRREALFRDYVHDEPRVPITHLKSSRTMARPATAVDTPVSVEFQVRR